MKVKSKKATMSLASIYGIILSLVLAAIILGIGLYVMQSVQTEMPYNGIAYDSMNTTINSIGGFSVWFTIIVVVAAAAIIIGLVMKSFVFGRR